MSSPGREGNGMGGGEMGIWRRGVQMCTEEGGGEGRGEGRGLFFPSVFVFFWGGVSLKKKKSFNEHVKVFTMFCIY